MAGSPECGLLVSADRIHMARRIEHELWQIENTRAADATGAGRQ